MANLLPPQLQKKIRRDEFLRFVEAGALVSLACAVVALVCLVPSYVALRELGSTGTPSAAGADTAVDTAAIVQTKDLLAQLGPLAAATTTPTAALSEALLHRTSDISIDAVSYTSGRPSVLVLEGQASDPASVNAYESALSADPLFSSVSVPVGALVGTGGGQFTITLQGNF